MIKRKRKKEYISIIANTISKFKSSAHLDALGLPLFDVGADWVVAVHGSPWELGLEALLEGAQLLVLVPSVHEHFVPEKQWEALAVESHAEVLRLRPQLVENLFIKFSLCFLLG